MSFGPPGPTDGGGDHSSKSERARERFAKKARKEDAKSKKAYEKRARKLDRKRRKGK